MYKILEQKDSTEIFLYSLIESGITLNELITKLDGIPKNKPITLRINSDGGDVFSAFSLYNYLKERDVNVIIDGVCASAASIVAMAGKTVTMKQGSMFMIHRPTTSVAGDSERLQATAEILEKIAVSIADIYMTRFKGEREDVVTLMFKESWLTPEEAKAYGFVDEIEEAPGQLSYEDGIKAERERIRAIDELYAPGRESMLHEAKYVKNMTAKDLAVEIVKAEQTERVSAINGLSVNAGDKAFVSSMLDIIRRKRGE